MFPPQQENSVKKLGVHNSLPDEFLKKIGDVNKKHHCNSIDQSSSVVSPSSASASVSSPTETSNTDIKHTRSPKSTPVFDRRLMCAFIEGKDFLDEIKNASPGELSQYLPALCCMFSKMPFFIRRCQAQAIEIVSQRVNESLDIAQAVSFLQQSNIANRHFFRDVETGSAALSVFAPLFERRPEKGYSIDIPDTNLVCHPFVSNILISKIVVGRVFKSKTQPIELTLYNRENNQPCEERVIFKAGDDLRQDGAVLEIFRLFNWIWRTEKLCFKGIQVRAHVYNCVAMGNKMGCIEFIDNCVPLKDINVHGKFTKEQRNRLIAYSAGSFVGSWILGIKDRHNDNILVERSGKLFHIDFGFTLNQTVKVDTAGFAITEELANIIGPLWGEFKDVCIRAFAVLRKHTDLILEYSEMMLGPYKKYGEVHNYLQASLMLDKNLGEACLRIKEQVENAPSSIRTKFKNIIHGIAVDYVLQGDSEMIRSSSSDEGSSGEDSGSGSGLVEEKKDEEGNSGSAQQRKRKRLTTEILEEHNRITSRHNSPSGSPEVETTKNPFAPSRIPKQPAPLRIPKQPPPRIPKQPAPPKIPKQPNPPKIPKQPNPNSNRSPTQPTEQSPNETTNASKETPSQASTNSVMKSSKPPQKSTFARPPQKAGFTRPPAPARRLAPKLKRPNISPNSTRTTVKPTPTRSGRFGLSSGIHPTSRRNPTPPQRKYMKPPVTRLRPPVTRLKPPVSRLKPKPGLSRQKAAQPTVSPKPGPLPPTRPKPTTTTLNTPRSLPPRARSNLLPRPHTMTVFETRRRGRSHKRSLTDTTPSIPSSFGDKQRELRLAMIADTLLKDRQDIDSLKMLNLLDAQIEVHVKENPDHLEHPKSKDVPKKKRDSKFKRAKQRAFTFSGPFSRQTQNQVSPVSEPSETSSESSDDDADQVSLLGLQTKVKLQKAGQPIMAPPWQPDESVRGCNKCKIPFTFTNRRHHCRLCGYVFCDNCAPIDKVISQRMCKGCKKSFPTNTKRLSAINANGDTAHIPGIGAVHILEETSELEQAFNKHLKT